MNTKKDRTKQKEIFARKRQRRNQLIETRYVELHKEGKYPWEITAIIATELGLTASRIRQLVSIKRIHAKYGLVYPSINHPSPRVINPQTLTI